MAIKRKIYFAELEISDKEKNIATKLDLIELFTRLKAEPALSLKRTISDINHEIALDIFKINLIQDSEYIEGMLTFADKRPRHYLIDDSKNFPDKSLTLPTTKALAFVTYFKIFFLGAHAVLCFVNDIHGPTITHLKEFLREQKLNQVSQGIERKIKRINYTFLKKKTTANLNEDEDITELKLAFKAPILDQLKKLDKNIFQSAKLQDKLGAKYYTIILKSAKRYGKNSTPLHIKIARTLKFWNSIQESDLTMELDEFIIKRSGGFGKIEAFNFLEDLITSEIELPAEIDAENIDYVGIFDGISVGIDDKLEDIKTYLD